MAKFLRMVAVSSDPKVKIVLTPTGQTIGWMKHEHDEWAFVPSSQSARLTIDLLEELRSWLAEIGE